MPYVYVGKRNFFLGKTLWEIVGNLRNFGVGRMLIRSKFERYPEVTYYRIVKANPLMDEVCLIPSSTIYSFWIIIWLIHCGFTCRKTSSVVFGSRKSSAADRSKALSSWAKSPTRTISNWSRKTKNKITSDKPNLWKKLWMMWNFCPSSWNSLLFSK